MPSFRETKGYDILHHYNGLDLMRRFAPKTMKTPKVFYRMFYEKTGPEIVAASIRCGMCSKEEGKALEEEFDRLYGDL